MPDTSARLLRLLSLLQTPREWPGSELATRLEVSHRTIRRDIDRLRDLGYPVEATMGAAGGYRLVAGSAMPPLLLDDEEAVAIAVGLRTAARHAIEGIEEASVRALAKLQQVLPSRLRYRVGTLNAATVPAGDSGPPVDPEHLTVLAAAIATSERVRFDYLSMNGEPSRRLVEPHRLVAAGRRWYLVAYDNDRADWRNFRVDRIAGPQRTGVRVAPREVPGGDAAAYLLGHHYSLLPTYEAVATVHAPIEQVRRRLGESAGELSPLSDSRCELRMGADTLEWLAFRLVQLDSDFEVHSPPELAAYLGRLGSRVLRAAGA